MNASKSYEFGESDFTAVDAAILSEQQKSRWILKDYKQRWWERWSKTTLYLCCALAVLVVAASIAIWLWNYEYPTTTVVAYSGEKSAVYFPTQAVEQGALETLDNNTYGAATVDTSFVVFYNALTEDGRSVVTGRKFEPTDLANPVEQYCYMEIPESEGVTAINLAESAGGLTKVVTKDPGLVQLVQPYCNFTLE
jgi:hypothetical protein